MSEKASIGIIGGADGPTAIMVAGDPIAVIIAAVVVVAVVGLIIWKIKKKK